LAELFHQNYSPVAGSILLSALVASLPPLLLALMLAYWRFAPWKSAIAGATSAFLLAWLIWGMPFSLTVAAATHGMAFGLWPICWIVFSSVMFYNLSVESGDFDVIRRSLARLTTDRRIQILLVAFCFGALIEGIAGFGAPVAITAAMLAGLGFEPIMAAVMALIASGSLLALAQEPSRGQGGFTFHTAVDLVTLNATVTNGSGHAVTGLRAQDFIVYEDGHPQRVELFAGQRPRFLSSATKA
jgi:hypothetical protein